MNRSSNYVDKENARAWLYAAILGIPMLVGALVYKLGPWSAPKAPEQSLTPPTTLVCAGPANPVPTIIYGSKPITRYDGAFVIIGPDGETVFFEKLAMERCTAVPAEMAKHIEEAYNGRKAPSGLTQTQE